MSLYHSRYVHYDVTEWAVACIRANWYGDDFYEGRPVSHEFLDTDGFVTCRFVFDHGGDGVDVDYVCVALRSGDVPDLRSSLRSPGWQNFTFESYNPGGDFPFPWSESVTVWKSRIVDFAITFLSFVFGAAVNGLQYREDSLAYTYSRMIVGSWFIEQSGEVFVMHMKLYGNHGPGPLNHFNYLGYVPKVEGIGNTGVVVNTRALESIAKSAEDIAMTRIEVSANNGDSMFSIVGGTRAASED